MPLFSGRRDGRLLVAHALLGGSGLLRLREEEAAAASVGISPVRFKLLAFVIGTGMAGLGGALYAHFMRFISASDFAFRCRSRC